MNSGIKVVILSGLVLVLSVLAAYWNLIDPTVLGRILAAAMVLFGLAEAGGKFAEGYKARVATDPNAKEKLAELKRLEDELLKAISGTIYE